jgi:predicted metal-dependent phosphoesterase TrpH
LLRIDLHIHTRYSRDSNTSLKSIIRRCQKIGLGAVAITDHNTIAGALEMKRIAPFPVIVGEEVLTSKGEILGYFLTEEIPKRLSPEETVARIKAQGGLVGIPHPFDRLRPRSIIRSDVWEKLMPYVDIIEAFNSRVMFPSADLDTARHFAQSNGFLASAGSDAHTPREVGRAYVEMPEFNDVAEFKAALAQGNIFGQRTIINPLVSFSTPIRKLFGRLRQPFPSGKGQGR